MKFRIYASLLLFVFALAVPTIATATIQFNSSNIPNQTIFQQTQNNPCVIGDPSCKEPANFNYNSQSGTPSGQGGTYDLTSPAYLASGTTVVGNANTLDVIPTSFTIGIDENIATGGGSEYLVAFRTLLCNSAGNNCNVDANNSYQPATPTAVPDNHNGNGYSDVILTGFSLVTNSVYRFEAVVSNDTDGMEEFFIIPSGTTPVSPVPEPASIFMLGSTLIGIGAITRRRWNRAKRA